MKVNNNNNPVLFNGLVPALVLKELAKQNTVEARKLLNSCRGFNAAYRGAQTVNPDKIAREMQEKFHINCDFGNNPLIASFFALTANIFHKLGFAKPTNAFFKDLRGSSYCNALGLCTIQKNDAELFRRFGMNFPAGSVIINKAYNWENIPYIMKEQKSINHLSTSHFLSTFIHEFVHNAHLENLKKKYSNAADVMQSLRTRFTNYDTIYTLEKETSRYGSTSPCEMIAEEMTELIVDSLDPETIRPNEMIFKLLRKREPNFMDKLIDASWNGNLQEINRLVNLKARVSNIMYNRNRYNNLY